MTSGAPAVAAPPPGRSGAPGAGGGRTLLRYAGLRLAVLPVHTLLVATATFLLVGLLPGDVARSILGPLATPGQIADLNARLGLDRPLLDRYGDYLGNLLHGRLGTSLYSDESVASAIGTRLPATLGLVLPALVVAVLVGLALAAAEVWFPRGVLGLLPRAVVTVLQSVPDFVLALLAIFLLFSTWAVLPGPEGQLGFADTAPPRHTGLAFADALLAGQPDVAASAARHLVLPVLTLGLTYSVLFARTARAVLALNRASDHVEFARALGLPERRLLLNVLAASRTTLLTYVAIVLAALVGGAAVVETVFGWGGLGQWAVEAIRRQDVPAVQGFVLVTATATVLVFLVLDVLSAALDPRIRVHGRA